jgi:hypothetical protein
VGFRSLEELREPDERTLRFAPPGLAMGGTMRPEDAAVFQQQVISHAELVPAVPEGTRNTFERLRMLYPYGVLCYEIFTVVEDQAHLVMEHALRERFLDFYDGSVPFEDADGRPHPVQASTVDELFKGIRKGSRLRGSQQRRLRLRRTRELIYFDGMLDSLLRWARSEGLLRGQRNRGLEPLLKWFRNYVAHGAGDHLVMPVDAARTLSDVAEVINRLWGSPTPGGRLYPAPIGREVQVVAWSADGTVMSGPADNFPAAQERDDWTYVLVRAVHHDQGLMRFDALFETTIYPCELLWGPGTWLDAAAWLKDEQPAADEAEILDRLFFVHYRDSRLYLPRNPDVAAGLNEDERQGIWYLVQADSPVDAFGHARRVVAGQSSCSDGGPCGQCAVETVGTGTWQEMIDLAATSGTTITPHRPPDTRVTSMMGWPRHNEILGNGNWAIPPNPD